MQFCVAIVKPISLKPLVNTIMPDTVQKYIIIPIYSPGKCLCISTSKSLKLCCRKFDSFWGSFIGGGGGNPASMLVSLINNAFVGFLIFYHG